MTWENISWFWLGSVIATVLSVLFYILLKNWKITVANWVKNRLIILALGFLIVGSFYSEHLLIVLIFGILAGSLMQAFTDITLTKHVLIYHGKSWKILKTPWWMSILWCLALAQLMYFCHHILTISGIYKFIVFMVIATAYFVAFELLVGNFAGWWTRKDCERTLNVAHYAVVAEILTVFTVWLFSARIMSSKSMLSLIGSSSLVGIIIASAFLVCFAFAHKPTEQTI